MIERLRSRLPGIFAVALFDRRAWRFFGGFLVGRRARLAGLSLASTATSLLVIPTLLLVKYAFDIAIRDGNIQLLIGFGAGILLVRVFSAGIGLYLRHTNLQIIMKIIIDIRESLLRKLFTLSRQTYTEMDRDQAHAQIVQDTQRVSDMTNVLLATVLPATLTSLVLLVVMLVLNPYLMLILLAILPVLAISSVASGGVAKKSVSVFHRAFEQFSKGILFVLHHMELAELQSSQAREVDRQLGHLEQLGNAHARMAFRFALHSQVQSTLASLGIVLILVVGGASVATGRMTLGDFVAFYVAAGLLNSYVNQVIGGLPQLIAGDESLKTLRAFSETDSKSPYTGTTAIDFHGSVSIVSASFSYGNDYVLKDVSLDIQPGRITALVGANGAGKSTLAHIVLGLYRPTSGEVFADGISYSVLDVVQLRRQIGVVPQHPAFFAGSIRENLTYGSGDVSDELFIQAIEAAQLRDFIDSLPEGDGTQVGSDGVLLSGGQCQRMALARALLRQPCLLIMDEPTNHLDADSVRLLLHNIRQLAQQLSILLISHDPMVISVADCVHHLKNGQLFEQRDALSAG